MLYYYAICITFYIMKIILIGMMGAGKSSIGKNLAEKTSARFIDVDEYIQHKYKSTISQIFENEGEDFFRQITTSMALTIIPTIMYIE